jgi:hypothetical protein
MPQPQESPPRDPFAELQRLRDQIRLKIHLASLEARAEFDRLEQRAKDIEAALSRKGARVGDAVRQQAKELVRKLDRFIHRNLPG